MDNDFAADVAAIQAIAAVPTILDVVCRTTGMGFAAVARVTEDRWIACGVRDLIGFGLKPGGELKVETTICHAIRQSGLPVVIDHVTQDEAFCTHPTPAMYGFESYVSTPIVLPDGRFFGTLCAIDPKPARVKTLEAIGMFKLFADLIAFHLDAHHRLALSDASLMDERRTAQLREQFIAILGHDLRNPLASIDAGARLLSKTPHDAKAAGILATVHASVGRMVGLIENLLDFARGRLGGGLDLDRSMVELEQPLRHVVDELRASHPNRLISADLELAEPVYCDAARISQLLSNLLANALTHGAPTGVVLISAANEEGSFRLSVTNGGDPISPAAQAHLFQPFERGRADEGHHGLGLGLFIAAEIAKAHAGELSVSSDHAETVFSLVMPSRA